MRMLAHWPVAVRSCWTVIMLGALAGCSASPDSERSVSGDLTEDVPMSIQLTSTAFNNGERIPARHTADGEDLSPPLAWSRAPEGTRQWALICDDPDAPTREPWVHWVIYAIPADTRQLPEGVPNREELDSPPGARQGRNSWSSGTTIGYRGPDPPSGHGVHHYHFRLYALDAELDLPPGLTKNELLKAIQGHVLAAGELVGTYEH